jgi:hypothetical protein
VDEVFVRQMEMVLNQSIIERNLDLSSSAPHRDVQIGYHMKEPTSPPNQTQKLRGILFLSLVPCDQYNESKNPTMLAVSRISCVHLFSYISHATRD